MMLNKFKTSMAFIYRNLVDLKEIISDFLKEFAEEIEDFLEAPFRNLFSRPSFIFFIILTVIAVIITEIEYDKHNSSLKAQQQSTLHEILKDIDALKLKVEQLQRNPLPVTKTDVGIPPSTSVYKEPVK